MIEYLFGPIRIRRRRLSRVREPRHWFMQGGAALTWFSATDDESEAVALALRLIAHGRCDNAGRMD